MDCEQFDQHVMELLYEEADKSLSAQLQRHVEHCKRCAAQWSELRAVRKMVVLAKYEVPVGVEEEVLELAREYQRRLPWHRRLGRWISWAGAYSMRPQIAMGALLLLMIGSGLILVRTKPGAWQMGVVRVTERGVPERVGAESAQLQDPALLESAGLQAIAAANGEHAGASRDFYEPGGDGRNDRGVDGQNSANTVNDTDDGQVAVGQGASDGAGGAAAADTVDQGGDATVQGGVQAPLEVSEQFTQALKMYQDKKYGQAYRAFDRIAMAGGPQAAAAAMYAANSVRISAGCSFALPRFDSVAVRFSGTPQAIEAKWQAASCARIVGDYIRARLIYRELAQNPGLRERAEKELARIPPGPNTFPSRSSASSDEPSAVADPSPSVEPAPSAKPNPSVEPSP